MADERAIPDDADQPDPHTAKLTEERLKRFIWHPDDIMVVRRNGVDIPPTKLSDLVAREKADAEARAAAEDHQAAE